jgi:hypothetical protein
MTLEVNGKVVSRNPTPEVIRDSLSSLNVHRDGEGFLILARDDMTYVQVSGDSRRGFDAEYQEGSIDRHYRAENASFPLEEVAAMLCEYLTGEVDWEKYGAWKRITW